MTFEWAQYLNVARELASVKSDPPTDEARSRSAISRAYYAAFCTARNFLLNREGLTISRSGRAHGEVRRGFLKSSDKAKKQVANRLKQLKEFRRRADYDDEFVGVEHSRNQALKLAKRIIDSLRGF